MCFVYAMLVFGFAFAIRVSRISLEHKLSTRNALTKIGTLTFLFSLSILICLVRSYLQVFFVLLIPGICLTLNYFWNRIYRESRFQSEFYACLNFCILRMKSGDSFRASFSASIEECDPRARPRLRELRDVVVFSQQARQFDFIARELSAADRDSHSAIRRCCALRERIRKKMNFDVSPDRQRSNLELNR